MNPTAHAITVDSRLEGFSAEKYQSEAHVTVLSGDSPGTMNSFDDPEKIVPLESQMSIADSFVYEAPAYSLTVLRIPAK